MLARVIPPPDNSNIIGIIAKHDPRVFSLLKRADVKDRLRDANNKYYSWTKVKRLPPPKDMTAEEFWACLKWWRVQGYRPLCLSAERSAKFVYWLPDSAQKLLHRIDTMGAGTVESSNDKLPPAQDRERFLITSLMEEAIASSIVEGAVTTRAEAKKMLRENRSPRTDGERMVRNNYLAIRKIQELHAQSLSIEMLHGLHRTMTEGTLRDPRDAGRFQESGEKRIAVVDDEAGEVVHEPPPAEEIPRRIEEVLHLANDRDEQEFMHPVVRAILLHFAISYIHPYVDGNGRTARAVFYWSMLNQGYLPTQYLSVSSIIRQGPSKYYLAFKNSETDGFDATYFVLYHLGIIDRALTAFHDYLNRKRQELDGTARLLREYPGLNHRQRALLAHALRNTDAAYTFESHRNSHQVSDRTARNDLLSLVSLGFLERIHGRPLRFMPIRNIQGKIDAVK
jgi:Fic family protein